MGTIILSARELSKTCNVHYKTVYGWISRGKIKPDIIKLDKNNLPRHFYFLDKNVEKIVDKYGK